MPAIDEDGRTKERHYYNRPRLQFRARTRISKIAINPAWRFLLPVFAVWLLLYGSYALSRPSLPDGPGTMHAEIAREMVSRYHWLTPVANGQRTPVSSKTLDRSIAASFKLLGVSDWAARLPIALCVLALAITAFFFGRTLFVWNAAGLYAALFLLAFPLTFLATRNLTDRPVATLLTSLFAFLLWELLIARTLALGSALGVTALACLVVLFCTNGPGMLLPFEVIALCWLVRRIQEPARQAQLFLVGWAACAVLYSRLFEHGSRGIVSGLCAMPPLALLLGGWLADHEALSREKNRSTAYAIFVFGLLAAAVALFFALSPHFGVSFYYHSFAVGAARASLLIAAAALIAGVTGHLLFRLRNRVRIANCFLAGTFAGLIIAIQVGLVMASPWFSSQILADAIRPELETGDSVVIDGTYTDASSMAFYLERPLLIAQPPGTSASLQGMVDIDRIWTGAARVYLWTSVSHPLGVPAESFVVAQSGGKLVLSNRPNAAGANF